MRMTEHHALGSIARTALTSHGENGQDKVPIIGNMLSVKRKDFKREGRIKRRQRKLAMENWSG